jgi:hypothetical protein
VRPIDLIGARTEVAKWCRSPSGHLVFNAWHEDSRGVHGGSYMEALRPGSISRSIEIADLYYVTQEMSALAAHAATTLGPYVTAAEDFPAADGLMVFEEPILFKHYREPTKPAPGAPPTVRPLLMAGCHWMVRSGHVLVSSLVRRGDDPELANTISQWQGSPPPLLFDALAPIALGEPLDVISSWDWTRAFVSACLLMGQPTIATSRMHQLDRLERANLRRRRLDPQPVRIVRLRRAVNPDASEDASAREYHHRWLVRGHWRQQAYGPGRVERKPIWIAPHIKGPEGAPLLTGEKVYAWVR